MGGYAEDAMAANNPYLKVAGRTMLLADTNNE
jgi:hypothetical protein